MKIYQSNEVAIALTGFSKDFPIVGWDSMTENETFCIFSFKDNNVSYLKCRLKIEYV